MTEGYSSFDLHPKKVKQEQSQNVFFLLKWNIRLDPPHHSFGIGNTLLLYYIIFNAHL